MTSPAGVPTRARYFVVVFAVTLAVIQYIDRVCISQAAPLITAEFHLTPVQMGYVFAAFTWAYALFEIPGGWLGDKLGPRKVLTRVVLWWSFFTAATGWTWNFVSLATSRALFGAGEAGCFPNLTKAFTTWLKPDERVKAQSILWLSARWGGAFTPLLVVLVLQFVGWRRSFEIFGVLGVVWAAAFYFWFRDDPREHPSVNAAERALLTGTANLASAHANVPWRRFLGSTTTWLLWGQYFCLSYGWYFYPTWLPTYLQEARGQAMARGALLAGLPLFFGGIGCFVSGFATAGLSRRIGVRRVAAAARLRGLQRGGGDAAALGQARGPDPGHDRDGPRELLQRPRDAPGVGRLHGRRRQVRRHLLRQHEHDGQLRRRGGADRRGVHPAGDGAQLGPHLLRLGRGLSAGRDPLALHRSRDAPRPGGGGVASERRAA